jgi:hypothetical protein
MKPGATVLTVMPNGASSRPAEGQAHLGGLGGGVGGPARRRPVGDLGVDLHDAAVAPVQHPGQHRAADQHRAHDEVAQLGQVVGPGHVGDRGLGLRAGGVEDQHVNRAEAARDRGAQPGGLTLVRDISEEGPGGAALSADGVADRIGQVVARAAIDRDGEPVTRQAHRDRRPQPSRTARHQRHPSTRFRHAEMIPPRPARSRRRHRSSGGAPLTQKIRLWAVSGNWRWPAGSALR